MKTVAQIIHHKNFPLDIIDSDGNRIYCEAFDGFWWKRKLASNGKLIYLEYSTGQILDRR